MRLVIPIVVAWFIGFLLLLPNQTAVAQNPEGVWRGRWTSESTGHSGPMRVKIQQRSDGQYDARFTGRFAVIIPFTYKTTLTPTYCDSCETDVLAVKKLGPILGSYRMQGSFDANQFRAGFQAGKDSGKIEMRRVR